MMKMRNKIHDLIILGPQGSGKGTQAKLLAEKFGHVHLGSGDLLREVAKEDTALGRKIHRLINVEGQLAPDELIADIFKDKIANLPKAKKVILDGFPRTLRQLTLMKEFWGELRRGDYKVIFVELLEDEAIRRLASRLTCENCGAIYIAGKAPKKCTRCGGRLAQRPDDKPEAIRKRLELFKKETMPIIDEFRKEKRLIRVDGSPSIAEVQREIIKKLNLQA